MTAEAVVLSNRCLISFSPYPPSPRPHHAPTVGDAPTAFARYRLFKAVDGAIGAEVDRLAVMQVYRRAGFTRQILHDVLADAQKFTDNTVSVLRLTTVADSWMKVVPRCSVSSCGYLSVPSCNRPITSLPRAGQAGERWVDSARWQARGGPGPAAVRRHGYVRDSHGITGDG